jgi:hypothetical protein
LTGCKCIILNLIEQELFKFSPIYHSP